jgi:hypothetical protein
MLVRGEHFPALADKVLMHYGSSSCDVDSLTDGDSVYCDTHDLHMFRDELMKHKDLLIITHNSDGGLFDGNPTRDVDVNTDLYDGCYRKWFAQNSLSSKNNIIPIPIGFENTRWDKGGVKQKTFDEFDLNVNPSLDVYLNCQQGTNRFARGLCYNECHNMDFVTKDKPTYPFPAYISRMSDHKFVLCPDGNGIDCHRTWETLFLGRIPVIKNRSLRRLYKECPVMFVNEWKDLIGLDFSSEYDKIRSEFNREILEQEYWNGKIK